MRCAGVRRGAGRLNKWESTLDSQKVGASERTKGHREMAIHMQKKTQRGVKVRWAHLAMLTASIVLILVSVVPPVFSESAGRADEVTIAAYILHATSRKRKTVDFTTPAPTDGSYARWSKKEIVYVTIEPAGIDERLVSTDLRMFMERAKTPNLNVAWCQIKVSGSPTALPECAKNATADIVTAYLKTEGDAEAIAPILASLQFNSVAAASKIQNDSAFAIYSLHQGYCLGSLATQGSEIEAAFLLADATGSIEHVRCSAFFSFVSLGVIPAPLKSLLGGEHDVPIFAKEIGQNPTTALRFLYSDYVESDMTWSQYSDALRLWLRANVTK